MAITLPIEKLNTNHYPFIVGLHMASTALDPSAECYFGQGTGHITGKPDLRDALAWLKAQKISVRDYPGISYSPITFGPYDINWYTIRNRMQPWGGQMSPFKKALLLQGAIDVDESSPQHAYGKLPKGERPLGFDIVRAGASQPQDVGCRTDDGIQFKYRTTLELLCLLGYQKFRPKAIQDTKRRGTYEFHAWGDPLPLDLIPLASCGMLPGVKTVGKFAFDTYSLVSQGNYYIYYTARSV